MSSTPTSQRVTDIDQWRRLAEQTLGRGASRDWNEYDFEQVSDTIFDKTDTRLSISTLKRLWGRIRYDSSPSTATLNVLARFLDFHDWREFQQSLRQPVPSAPAFPDPSARSTNGTPHALATMPSSPVGPSAPAEPLSPASPIPTVSPPLQRRDRALPSVLAILFCATAIVSGLTMKSPAPTDKIAPNPSMIKFESRKTTDDLPNSVVFEYDASAFHSDQVSIQQSWDSTRREKVLGDGHYHTSIYYRPGFFKAKLVVDGEVKKTSDVFIRTKGWIGQIEQPAVPIYLKESEIRHQTAIGISAATLTEKTGSSVFNGQRVIFSNVREFPDVDPGEFTLHTSLRNTSTLEQSPCRHAEVVILSKESAIILPLSAKGCISDLNIFTGDTLLLGKNNDFSALGCDFSKFQDLTCSVSNHHLKVLLNGQQVLDTEQKTDIGSIVGLRIIFEGAGEFRDISLSSHGRMVYQESF